MAVVDYVVVGVVALSAIIGLVRGFVREVLSLAIWVAAVMLAIGFSGDLAAWLPPRIEGESLRFIVAFAGIFVGALIVGGIVQWLVKRLVETTGLSGTDRVLGFVFGGLRGAAVCIVAVIVLRPFAAEQPWWRNSHAIPVLSAFESDLMRVVASLGDAVNALRERH